MKGVSLGAKSGGHYTYEFADHDANWDSKKRLDAVLPPSSAPTPQLHLSALRFIVSVLWVLVLLVGILIIFVRGIVIDKGVLDDLGSSKNVDSWIELYQTINGYITALVGELTNLGVGAFLAVAMTYLGNVKLYPGDDPRAGPGRLKWLLLWAFVPVVTFLLNVAISATFISHTTTGVVRVFLPEDLVATNALSVKADNTTTVSTLDTVLRAAVLRKVTPFEVLADSPCVLGNSTEDKEILKEDNPLPAVKEVKATAVVYGFQPQDWNLDAMPVGLKPTHSVKLQLSDVNASYDSLAAQFADFLAKTNVSWLTTYELLLQGKLLFERGVSDSNGSASYPCFWVDGLDPMGTQVDSSDGSSSGGESTNPATNTNPPTTTNRSTTTDLPSTLKHTRHDRGTHMQKQKRRALQETTGSVDDDDWFSDGSVEFEEEVPVFDVYDKGEFKGMRRCYGAISSLRDLADYRLPKMHSMEVFVDTMVDGFIQTVEQIAPEDMDLTFETYEINPLMKLTVMTLDMPYLLDTPYRDVTDYCEGGTLLPELVDETWTAEVKEIVTSLFCDQKNYPYDKPRTACGHANCIFLDKSNAPAFKKQLQLMPYLTNCSTADLTYSTDFSNFLPHYCVPQNDSVFLYGLGSYMAGELFDNGGELGLPFISNPRRHVMLTFAKLEWQFIDLSTRFQADCSVSNTTAGCMGLLHDLQNVTVPAATTSTNNTDKYLRLLVLGKDNLPQERLDTDYRNPVQLASLNTRPFYYENEARYFEWEYLQKDRFTTSTWPANTSQAEGNLKGDQCTPLIDAYIAQVEANHYYIDNPIQPLYTSALFYLFQDAAVKTVKLTKNATTGLDVLELQVLGTTSLNGDLERHEIKFSLPLLSLISTSIGLGVLVLLALLVLACPTQRLAKSDATTVLEQYAELQQDDQYPEQVYDRGLVLPSGDRVPMDEYIAESITFHHVRDDQKKIYL